MTHEDTGLAARCRRSRSACSKPEAGCLRCYFNGFRIITCSVAEPIPR